MTTPYDNITEQTTDVEKIDIVINELVAKGHGAGVQFDKLKIPLEKQKAFEGKLIETDLFYVKLNPNSNHRMSFFELKPTSYTLLDKHGSYSNSLKSKSDHDKYTEKLELILNYLRRKYKDNGEIISREDFEKATGVSMNDPAVLYLVNEKGYVENTKSDINLTPLGYNFLSRTDPFECNTPVKKEGDTYIHFKDVKNLQFNKDSTNPTQFVLEDSPIIQSKIVTKKKKIRTILISFWDVITKNPLISGALAIILSTLILEYFKVIHLFKFFK